MKYDDARCGLQTLLLGCLGVGMVFNCYPVWAKPRMPMPPWPEVHLALWSFDEPLWASSLGLSNRALVVDSTRRVESWSGFALNRPAGPVQPANLPMATTADWKVATDEGAIRLWYSPAWSSSNTGLGRGPGYFARLLELATKDDGKDALVWWSLYVSPDGNTLYLSMQREDGPLDCLKVENLGWQAGEWHMLTVVYGSSTALAFPQPWLRRSATDVAQEPRETHLYIEGQLGAIGPGLPSVPLVLGPATALVVGSDAEGRWPAVGQIEQLTTFAYPLAAWELNAYYEFGRKIAALGPVTEAEEEARRAAYLVRKAAAESSNATIMEMVEGGGFQLDSMQYTNGFWLLTPFISQGTNLLLTLVNVDTNKSYDIYFRGFLESSNNIWSVIAARGLQGQTNFTANMTNAIGFYLAIEGDDWDHDGSLNFMDAQPCNAGVSNLTVTIDSPLNGSTVQ